jgi:hypothetical protein
MKKTVPYLTTFLVVYLIVAFVKWQFNPSIWSEGSRALYVFLSSMCCLLVGLVKTGLKDIQ